MKKDVFIPFDQLIRQYNTWDMMNIMSAIQLDPQNHGKNVRIEEIISAIVTQPFAEGDSVPYLEFVKTITSEFPSSVYEDPTENLFTENIIFFGGNYTVLPGITQSGCTILNSLLRGIFLTHESRKKLPQEFVSVIHNGVQLMLILSDMIAASARLKRYQDVAVVESTLSFYEESAIEHLKKGVVFTHEQLADICKRVNISLTIIDEFIADVSDLNLSSYDPDNNPLLQRPIIKQDGKYLVLLPTAIVEALNYFIRRIADEAGVVEQLNQLFIDVHFDGCTILLRDMGWQLTSIKLPEEFRPDYMRELVLQFDNNKLAYFCLVGSLSSRANDEQDWRTQVEKRENEADSRFKEVATHLKNYEGLKDHQFLFLYVLIEDSTSSAFSVPHATDSSHQILLLRYSEFSAIVQSEDTDPLRLWKFAKVYAESLSQARLFHIGGILDAYVFYKNNDQSLFPTDHERPDFVTFSVGSSGEFLQKNIINRDSHAVSYLLENERKGDIPVYRYRKFAPLYTPEAELPIEQICLDCYSEPIWFESKVKSNRNDFIHWQLEALAFWMHKFCERLGAYLNNALNEPVSIIVDIDDRFFQLSSHQAKEVPLDQIEIPFSYNNTALNLKIPFELCRWYMQQDNRGERELMTRLLKSFRDFFRVEPLTDNLIQDIIDEAMPMGMAKMVTIFDATDDLQLAGFNLAPYRPIQECESSHILDHLVEYLALPKALPKAIVKRQDKNGLCHKIVDVLIEKLIEACKEFEQLKLIEWLLRLNETCTHRRAFRSLEVPARIACFSNIPDEIKTIQSGEERLVRTSLSYRCLIEFLQGYQPCQGTKSPNFDEVDRMLALMDQIISWGGLSDIINLELDDPEMGLLPSGRIGFDRTFENNYLKPFSASRAELQVHSLVRNFPSLFENKSQNKEKGEQPELSKKIDAVWEAEFGISLTTLYSICGDMINWNLSKQKSVITVHEGELFAKLKIGWSDAEVHAALENLCLKTDWKIGEPPSNFIKTDSYPWRYNRALSFIRRPLIKHEHTDGGVYYSWGFRHLLGFVDNLSSLLMSGRMQARPKTKLEDLLNEIRTMKGHDFRASAFNWLSKKSGLEVLEKEVSIRPGGHLDAPSDLGDIDILIIDHKNFRIYAVECKDTVDSRIIHEMKTEIDNYLGKDGRSGMIQKHVKREQWLQKEKTKLNLFVKDPEKYTLKALILSSNEIPLIFLKKDQLPLPVISMQRLKIEGVSLLNQL